MTDSCHPCEGPPWTPFMTSHVAFKHLPPNPLCLSGYPLQNPTIVREAIFTGAYLGVIPILRARMETAWPEVFASRPVTSMAVASVLAGVGASVATQPFDTVKTRMQANLGNPAFRWVVLGFHVDSTSWSNNQKTQAQPVSHGTKPCRLLMFNKTYRITFS